MLQDLLSLMDQHAALVALLVFAAALLEYVFPPFWGDTIMLVGCFLAGVDRADPVQVYAAAVLGSCLGALAAYGIGRRFGSASLSLMSRSRRARRFADRAERWQADHGTRILAVNRFLPGVRAFFLPLAGIAGMPLRTVAVWSTVSNVAYCGLLLGVGLAVGAGSADLADMQGQFRSASLLGAAVAVALVAGLTLRHFLTQRRGCSEGS
jgi:membrane-associated protein